MNIKQEINTSSDCIHFGVFLWSSFFRQTYGCSDPINLERYVPLNVHGKKVEFFKFCDAIILLF